MYKSIDESTAKCKPDRVWTNTLLKPSKREIKIWVSWVRSHAQIGYIYDVNVTKKDGQVDGTLGERVVLKLTSSIKENDVICFQWFFSSVTWMETVPFEVVGTCTSHQKNKPKTQNKLEKINLEFLCTDDKSTFCRWQDTKEVLQLVFVTVTRWEKSTTGKKNGQEVAVDGPEITCFYNDLWEASTW